MEPERKITQIVEPEGYTTFDSRYFPICMGRIVGEVTPILWDRLFEYRRTHMDPFGVFAYLVFINEMTALPATTRKHLADQMEVDVHIAGHVRVYPIVTNPLLRGVLTAVIWITGKEKFPATFSSTFEEAIKQAESWLHSRGLEPPKVPADYDLPRPEGFAAPPNKK